MVKRVVLFDPYLGLNPIRPIYPSVEAFCIILAGPFGRNVGNFVVTAMKDVMRAHSPRHEPKQADGKSRKRVHHIPGSSKPNSQQDKASDLKLLKVLDIILASAFSSLRQNFVIDVCKIADKCCFGAAFEGNVLSSGIGGKGGHSIIRPFIDTLCHFNLKLRFAGEATPKARELKTINNGTLIDSLESSRIPRNP